MSTSTYAKIGVSHRGDPRWGGIEAAAQALCRSRRIGRSSESCLSRMATIATTHLFGLSQINSEYLIRDPYLVCLGGVIECAAVVPENSIASMMMGDPHALLAAAQTAAERAMKDLAGHPPTAAIVFNCILRLQDLDDEATAEIKRIRDV